jgi:sugar lactone lactonase YvrE
MRSGTPICMIAIAACAHAAPAPDHVQVEREIVRIEHRLATASDDGAARYTLCALYDQLARRGDVLRCLAALDALGWSIALDLGDFSASRAQPDFGQLAARFAARDRVVSHSARAFTASADIVPENVAYDPKSGAFFLGSLTHGAVWRLHDGKLAKLVDTGSFAVIGMKIDPVRRTLWAATNGLGSSGVRSAELVIVDIDSGAVLARIAAPHDYRAHGFNDLVLTEGEEAFVTDSSGGAVWRASKSGALAPVVPAGTLDYPNGIAIAPDGKRLFVAYDLGVAIFDVATGAMTELQHDPAKPTAGIDGMYFHDGALVAIQNGIGAPRVVRLRLDDALARVTDVEVLEAGNPLFDLPTTGVVVGDDLYYVANCQLRRIDQNGKPTARLDDVVVLKLPLR